ncbi:MAG: hypothetical protein V3S01_00765, partial [Dehalococcoidia bacterium]
SREFRAGFRAGADAYENDPASLKTSAQLRRRKHSRDYINGYMDGSRGRQYKVSRAVDKSSRRRRNAPSSRQKADVYAEAKRLGFGRGYVDKVAKLREGARAAAPTSVNSLKRDHDRNAYWPVITAHDTHWHYTLKKQKRGWVTEFRRRDKTSARHYISRDNTASSKPTYYSTRNEAFRALLNHVTAGKHVPFKNPRRR